MKLTKKFTDYIIVRVYNSSKNSTVDCALINISEKNYLKNIKKRIQSIIKIKDPLFYCLSYWGYPSIWFLSNENKQDSIITPDLTKIENWSFINITQEEIDQLQQSEERIDFGVMKVFSDGNFMFTGYGKYSNNEFWTDDININELLKLQSCTQKKKKSMIR